MGCQSFTVTQTLVLLMFEFESHWFAALHSAHPTLRSNQQRKITFSVPDSDASTLIQSNDATLVFFFPQIYTVQYVTLCETHWDHLNVRQHEVSDAVGLNTELGASCD